ncbi:hypothetical protein KAZ57_02825 [Patescibacteria group bacterium]|nr:hypothetical protein [Patescibacteria group bacterium]
MPPGESLTNLAEVQETEKFANLGNEALSALESLAGRENFPSAIKLAYTTVGTAGKFAESLSSDPADAMRSYKHPGEHLTSTKPDARITRLFKEAQDVITAGEINTIAHSLTVCVETLAAAQDSNREHFKELSQLFETTNMHLAMQGMSRTKEGAEDFEKMCANLWIAGTWANALENVGALTASTAIELQQQNILITPKGKATYGTVSTLITDMYDSVGRAGDIISKYTPEPIK